MNTCVGQWTCRQGLVCSECIEGFGPSVTSLGYSCSKCAWYGIPLFLLVEFVPITVFYVIIILFQINLTSALFTAFVLANQFAISGFMASFGRYSFPTNTEYYLLIIIVSRGCHGDIHWSDVLLVVCVFGVVRLSPLALSTTAPQEVSTIVMMI